MKRCDECGYDEEEINKLQSWPKDDPLDGGRSTVKWRVMISKENIRSFIKWLKEKRR